MFTKNANKARTLFLRNARQTKEARTLHATRIINVEFCRVCGRQLQPSGPRGFYTCPARNTHPAPAERPTTHNTRTQPILFDTVWH